VNGTLEVNDHPAGGEQMADQSLLKPHHVAINVADIDAAIAWYGEVLGFGVERRDFIKGFRGRNALLKHGEFRIELFQNEHTIQRPAEQAPPPGTEMLGYRQMAFTVADLPAFTAMLEKKGADITARRPDGTVLFIRDNSGNVLEFST
jgi:catechol 2,3-dioxygenase-like lactoylglutathione lyase family enzyme